MGWVLSHLINSQLLYAPIETIWSNLKDLAITWLSQIQDWLLSEHSHSTLRGLLHLTDQDSLITLARGAHWWHKKQLVSITQ